MAKRFKVVTRIFYETAYLSFFIKHYYHIGFDQIVLLKADTIPLNLPAEFDADVISGKLAIVPVENTGNEILREHYNIYRDIEFDWVLNVDLDELLVFDFDKYENIGALITAIESSISPTKPVMQIAFRWACINRLDINPEIITIKDYTDNYPIEIYRYHKSIGQPVYFVQDPKINCHYYTCNPESGIELRDSIICHITKHDIKKPGPSAFDWGCILHLNTRSVANCLTKALTTQLRDNKKIKDLAKFRHIINGIDELKAPEYQGHVREDILKNIKDLLNNKVDFIYKINTWHSVYNINIDLVTNYVNKLIKLHPDTPVCDKTAEFDILKNLCIEKNINYAKCLAVLQMF